MGVTGGKNGNGVCWPQKLQEAAVHSRPKRRARWCSLVMMRSVVPYAPPYPSPSSSSLDSTLLLCLGVSASWASILGARVVDLRVLVRGCAVARTRRTRPCTACVCGADIVHRTDNHSTPPRRLAAANVLYQSTTLHQSPMSRLLRNLRRRETSRQRRKRPDQPHRLFEQNVEPIASFTISGYRPRISPRFLAILFLIFCLD